MPLLNSPARELRGFSVQLEHDGKLGAITIFLVARGVLSEFVVLLTFGYVAVGMRVPKMCAAPLICYDQYSIISRSNCADIFIPTSRVSKKVTAPVGTSAVSVRAQEAAVARRQPGPAA